MRLFPSQQKNEPTYNFVVPHRDPLRCPIGALAIMLHFMFDEKRLASQVAGWDWADASSWCKVCIWPIAACVHRLTSVIRSTSCLVGKSMSRCLGMVSHLDKTSVSSNKKAHLARRAIPTIMEDMGCVSGRPLTMVLMTQCLECLLTISMRLGIGSEIFDGRSMEGKYPSK